DVPELVPPHPDPAWPAPTHTSSSPRPSRLVSRAQPTARQWPPRTRPARLDETARRRQHNTTKPPYDRDATARVPTPRSHGRVSGLDPDTPTTSGSKRYRRDR